MNVPSTKSIRTRLWIVGARIDRAIQAACDRAAERHRARAEAVCEAVGHLGGYGSPRRNICRRCKGPIA